MSTWIEVCDISDIHPNTGICALVNQQQVAIFRQRDTDQVYAVSNYDPIGKANVLSRGLMAQLGDKLTVSSPLYKQHFDLETGVCVEENLRIPIYGAKVEANKVYVQIH